MTMTFYKQFKPLYYNICYPGGKVLTVTSGHSGMAGTRVISATRQTGTNMVTVNPKSFHISSVKNTMSTSAGNVSCG